MTGRGGWWRLLAVAGMLAGSMSCAETQANIVAGLEEYSIEVEPSSADEGNVLIDIDNRGSQEHELILVRSDDPDGLPVGEDGIVDVSQVLVVDRVEPFPPGRYRVMTPDIRFGSYVLFCNLSSPGPDGEPVGHYQQGMRGVMRIAQVDPVEDDVVEPPPAG